MSAQTIAPYRCKYDGAVIWRDAVGHRCPTRNCQWEYGVKGCEIEEHDGA